MAFVQQAINNNDNVSIWMQVITKDHDEKIGNGETKITNNKFEKINHNVHGFLEGWYFIDFQGCFQGPMIII